MCAKEMLKNATVDSCDRCGGVLLGDGTRPLLEFAADVTHSFVRDIAREPDVEFDLDAPIDCPECHQPMVRSRLYEVEVDRCGRHGTWLDDGELARLVARLDLLVKNHEPSSPAAAISTSHLKLPEEEGVGLKLPDSAELKSLVADGSILKETGKALVDGIVDATTVRQPKITFGDAWDATVGALVVGVRDAFRAVTGRHDDG
jgi:Zn-finger nucleic acid-binding protein